MQPYIRTLAEDFAPGPGWNLLVGASSSEHARSVMTLTGLLNPGLIGSPSVLIACALGGRNSFRHHQDEFGEESTNLIGLCGTGGDEALSSPMEGQQIRTLGVFGNCRIK
jgi:hypothetical protein